MKEQKINYDKYKRMQVILRKSEPNKEVTDLLQKNYQHLYRTLVKTEEDRDIFNDTYLKMTYKYNKDKSFIDSFIKEFQILKGAYYRDDKVFNYYFTELPAQIKDIYEEYTEPEKSKITLEDLRNAILEKIKLQKTKRKQ